MGAGSWKGDRARGTFSFAAAFLEIAPLKKQKNMEPAKKGLPKGGCFEHGVLWGFHVKL